MTIKIKICGLTDKEAVNAAAEAGADYAGFVYYSDSPRHLTLPKAAELKKLLPASVKSVSVLVDPDDALISLVQSELAPDYIQLHGKETPARVHAVKNTFPKMKIIKAIRVRTSDDVAQANRYASADMLLFDARPPDLPGALPGGNGLVFDWALLKDRQFNKPWFLSGGLTADNVVQGLHATSAQQVDVSSGVEKSPGVKDPALINAFIKAART